MGIVEQVDDIRANVDYKGRIQLGIMFGVPTDDVLQPQFIQRMQQKLRSKSTRTERSTV